MIAGFSGSLVSQAYLELFLLEVTADHPSGFDRRLLRWWQHVSRTLGPASSTRAILDTAVVPLLALLEHDRPLVAPAPVGLAGLLPSSDAIVLVVPWTAAPAAMWREAVRLGLSTRASWAIVGSGRSCAVIDCTRAWSRDAIVLDFAALTAGPRGLAALRALLNRDAMKGTGPRSLRGCVNASDAHAEQVCRSLSDGVLRALPALAGALNGGGRCASQRAAGLDQALTIVYRILFLLYAEARALVPTWNDIYREAYSVDALTTRALRSAPGSWKAFQAISRLAHAGCVVGDLEVTPFNGRLFSPRHTPLIEQRQVPDDVMREVLLSLATERTRHGRRRISYHDLGVEQLGSVYERVLDHELTDGVDAVLAKTSHARKNTGSFYTPRSLTEYLVKRSLSPLVEGRSAQQILELRVLDPAMGSGAFLVACCRFLADACEHALVRGGSWSAAEVTLADRASLRRRVAERCLYGVDLNATAVQLARVSLWLTTLAAQRPLTFLDHHLACGNSLVGAWLRDLSRPPAKRGRVSEPRDLPLFDDLIADEVSARVMPVRMRLSEASESVEIVRSKERALAALIDRGGPLARWSAAANAWCAAALWQGAMPSTALVAEWIAFATGRPTTLPRRQLTASLDQAQSVAAAHGAFHWELAFPEVFFDADGHPLANPGFDAVIGNPPWDMLRADTGSAGERAGAKGATASALRFCRVSRCYRLQSHGHANSYQLFLERAFQLVKEGGRVGLILPSGVATDHGSAGLRRHLLDRTTIDTWIGFDNRRRIFPIHRSVRFVVVATTNSGRTDTLRFRSGLTDPDDLHRNAAPPLAVARARLAAWDPEHLTLPDATSATALAVLTEVAERIPPMSSSRGWHVRFGRELNATEDRPQFVARGESARALPIVEGKQLTPFVVDVGRSQWAIPLEAASRLLGGRRFSRPRIAYRDVASATNRLTLIAAMLPANVVSTHTVFCVKSDLDERSQWCLLALMNSLAANYLVRLYVTTHVTTSLMARLPVPRPPAESSAFTELVSLARRLARTGVGDDSSDYAVLNAIAARLYGLTQDQYAFVLDSFPLISAAQRALCLAAYSGNNPHGGTDARNH